MDFRVLTHDDYPLVKPVADLSRYGGTRSIVITTAYHQSWIKNSEQTGYVFGAFEDEKLCAVLMTAVSTGTVCWYASLVFYDQHSSFPYELLNYANTTYAKKGYRQFMIGAESGFSPIECEQVCGIKHIVEISLPPNTRPKYGELWENVMMKELFPSYYTIYHFFDQRCHTFS